MAASPSETASLTKLWRKREAGKNAEQAVGSEKKLKNAKATTCSEIDQ
jgi:hypothetical protein